MVTNLFKTDANAVLKSAGLELTQGYVDGSCVAEALVKKDVLLQQAALQLKEISSQYLKNEPDQIRRAEMEGILEALLETIDENSLNKCEREVTAPVTPITGDNVIQLFRRK